MEVVKPSPVNVAKAYMKERGIKLGCRLPLHVTMRGQDMVGDKVKRTPPVDNIWAARRGTSSGSHPQQRVMSSPTLGKVKINKIAYVHSLVTLSSRRMCLWNANLLQVK